MVEEVHIPSKMLHNSINSTFIAFIPKSDCPNTFDDFRPISLCNCLYKIIAKIIAIKLKPILSNIISLEQFGFLKGKLIHEAIRSAQVGSNSIKTHKRLVSVIKIDLSKAYDRVSWLYLHLLLLHIGFNLSFVKWIRSCVTIVLFVVLINSVESPFFKSAHGLRQGCPLSPYLFMLVANGLSCALVEAKRVNSFQGTKLGQHERLTHLLFVDNVLIFCFCAAVEGRILKDILNLSCDATGMLINVSKSMIYLPDLEGNRNAH